MKADLNRGQETVRFVWNPYETWNVDAILIYRYDAKQRQEKQPGPRLGGIGHYHEEVMNRDYARFYWQKLIKMGYKIC